jgi:hypothetical protein
MMGAVEVLSVPLWVALLPSRSESMRNGMIYQSDLISYIP